MIDHSIIDAALLIFVVVSSIALIVVIDRARDRVEKHRQWAMEAEERFKGAMVRAATAEARIKPWRRSREAGSNHGPIPLCHEVRRAPQGGLEGSKVTAHPEFHVAFHGGAGETRAVFIRRGETKMHTSKGQGRAAGVSASPEEAADAVFEQHPPGCQCEACR